MPDERAKSVLDLVHCDVADPIEPCSYEKKCRYAVSLADDYSNLICFYFMRSKDQVVHADGKYLADMSPYGRIKKSQL